MHQNTYLILTKLLTSVSIIDNLEYMARKLNLSENSTLLKFQNMWVAFDSERNIIISAKTYLSLHKLIPDAMKGKVETTFINASKSYLAPYNGSI